MTSVSRTLHNVDQLKWSTHSRTAEPYAVIASNDEMCYFVALKTATPGVLEVGVYLDISDSVGLAVQELEMELTTISTADKGVDVVLDELRVVVQGYLDDFDAFPRQFQQAVSDFYASFKSAQKKVAEHIELISAIQSRLRGDGTA